MENIYTVTVGDVQHHYPGGTPYQQIAQEFQPQYPNDILLVERDERLCELGKRLDRDCTLKMITIQDKPGMQTYERSAIFLMLKAFYDVVGSERIERICGIFPQSCAVYHHPRDLSVRREAIGERRGPDAGIGIPTDSHPKALPANG